MAGKPLSRDDLRGRIMELLEIYAETLSEFAVRKAARVKWGVSERTSQRYAKAVLNLSTGFSKKRIKRSREEIVIKALARERQAAKDKQFSACAQMLTIYARVTGALDTRPEQDWATRAPIVITEAEPPQTFAMSRDDETSETSDRAREDNREYPENLALPPKTRENPPDRE